MSFPSFILVHQEAGVSSNTNGRRGVTELWVARGHRSPTSTIPRGWWCGCNAAGVCEATAIPKTCSPGSSCRTTGPSSSTRTTPSQIYGFGSVPSKAGRVWYCRYSHISKLTKVVKWATMSITIYIGCDYNFIRQHKSISTNFPFMIVTLLVFRTMGLCGTERTRSEETNQHHCWGTALWRLWVAFTHIISKNMSILTALFGYNSDFTDDRMQVINSMLNSCFISSFLFIISPRHEYGTNNI